MTGLEPATPTSVALCSIQLSHMSIKPSTLSFVYTGEGLCFVNIRVYKSYIQRRTEVMNSIRTSEEVYILISTNHQGVRILWIVYRIVTNLIVPVEGIEPTRDRSHKIYSFARLLNGINRDNAYKSEEHCRTSTPSL